MNRVKMYLLKKAFEVVGIGADVVDDHILAITCKNNKGSFDQEASGIRIVFKKDTGDLDYMIETY